MNNYKKRIFFILLTLLLSTQSSLALRVGDDAGNGGFAFKQSIKILKRASSEIVETIRTSDYPELMNHPERRDILERALQYTNLRKLPNESGYRGDRLLAMDYIVSPPIVKIYKAFYMSFAGTLDRDIEAASLEVQKRLLHEASHIWGYNEEQSEQFSIDFLLYEGSRSDNTPDRDDLIVKENQDFNGYKFNRLTNYCGHWVKHCGWYPDTKTRLINRNFGKWEGVNPHDRLEIQKGEKIGFLYFGYLFSFVSNIFIRRFFLT